MENVNVETEVTEEVVVEEVKKFEWLKSALIAVGGVALGVAAKVLFDKSHGDDEDEEPYRIEESVSTFEQEQDDNEESVKDD